MIAAAGLLLIMGALAVGAVWAWATGQRQLAAVLALALAGLIAWQATRPLDRERHP